MCCDKYILSGTLDEKKTPFKAIPIGSTLDTVKGKFHWMLGPGFIGDYESVFIKKNGYEIQERINVKVKIMPKLSLEKTALFREVKVK